MAVSLKHAFTCTLPDDPDTTVVRPSNWNAEHDLVAADGAFLVGTGTGVEEQDAATARSTMGAAAASHTHTASNVSDFSEAVDDRVAALLVAGTNVTLTYNDAAGTLTVDATGGGGGSVSDGDKGDIVVSGSGATWEIDSGVLSAFGRSLIDDANAAAARATLGLNLDILPFYQTRADLAAATVSASIDTIYVGGHTTEGKGAAVYVRLGSTPSPVKAWHIASADGAYWIIATWQRLSPEMLGAASDGSTNDTTVLQYTLDALATYPAIKFSAASYYFNGVLKTTQDRAAIHFENSKFLVGDTGTSGTLLNASTGKIGFHFQSIDQMEMTGSAELIGQGTPGTTKLAGMVFEKCTRLRVSAHFYYENMAAGRFVMWCDQSVFGDITAHSMYGAQTFGLGTAGTAEVVMGCVGSTFGAIQATSNYKPIRYLSVSEDASSARIDNSLCIFGPASGTAYAGSSESSVTSIRSASNCAFAPMTGTGFSLGLYLVRYSTDAGWTVAGNDFASVSGTYVSTGASVDAAIQTYIDSGVTIGANVIHNVNASCAGEFGIILASSHTTFGAVKITGSPTRGLVAHNGTVIADTISISGQNNEGVAIGLGCDFRANSIALESGPSGAASGGVRCWSTYGTGSKGNIQIGRITYSQGGSASNYLYTFMDLETSFETTAIGQINGAGSVGEARFFTDVFSVEKWRYLSTQAPTSGTYSVGSMVWKSNAASTGVYAYICTTAGTPGTWRSLDDTANSDSVNGGKAIALNYNRAWL